MSNLMEKSAARMMIIITALIMILSFAACSNKENAPINSGWKFDSVKSGLVSESASDYEEDEIPILFIDNECNVILYRAGKYHYGWISAQINYEYHIDFSDSTKSMIAKISGDKMNLSVEGDNKAVMVFKTTDERTMMPLADRTGPYDITARLVGEFTVEFTNNGDETWCYGEYYHLEALKNGKSYYLPPDVPISVHDLGHELAPGQSDTLTYDLTPYGTLEPGEYRIAAGDIGDAENFYYAYFTVGSDGTVSYPN